MNHKYDILDRLSTHHRSVLKKDRPWHRELKENSNDLNTTNIRLAFDHGKLTLN